MFTMCCIVFEHEWVKIRKSKNYYTTFIRRPFISTLYIIAHTQQFAVLRTLLRCSAATLSYLGWLKISKCQTPSKRRTDRLSVHPSLRRSLKRTDGQTRTATTSTSIAAVTPCRRRCNSSTMSRQTDGRTNRRQESNLAHFSLKMWHLVAIILMVYPIINWPNFVYLLVDPGFLSLSPLNFYEVSPFVHP